MTPNEFWDSEFKSILLYCDCILIKGNEDFKNSIILEEAVTNKTLKAHPLISKHPKVISLMDTFKKLFEK